MKLKYLGTGAAERIPAIFCNCDICCEARKRGGKDWRTQSQLLIDEGKLLIDFPGDTYYHAMKNGIALNQVETLLVTHWHSDHFYAEDIIMRQPPYGWGLTQTMEIYGPKKAADFYHRALRLEGTPEPQYLQYQIIQPFESIMLKEYKIWSFRALHGGMNGDCVFYGISNGGSSILYAHDTGKFDDEIYRYMEKENLYFDLVSLDCTHQICESSAGHMNYEENKEVKENMIEKGVAGENTVFVLNHFSHNGKMDYQRMKALSKRDGFVVSYDGMEIIVG